MAARPHRRPRSRRRQGQVAAMARPLGLSQALPWPPLTVTQICGNGEVEWPWRSRLTSSRFRGGQAASPWPVELAGPSWSPVRRRI
ncbi:hypothetical protein NL676_002081 [Syzygium grande]|nr:hypothetical protein NL676_002081 [Syzygium grande]